MNSLTKTSISTSYQDITSVLLCFLKETERLNKRKYVCDSSDLFAAGYSLIPSGGR